MVSYADVRRWKPEQLDAVHQQLGNRRDDLINLQDELDASRNPDGWTGDAAQRSADQHRELVERMRSLVAEVATVRAAVATAADEVTVIKRRVEMADREAEGHGFQITEEGGVRDVKPPENVPAGEAEQVRAQRIRVRDDLVDEIEKILDQAEATDAALAEALDAADEDEVRAGAGTTLASAAKTEDLTALADSAGQPPHNTAKANAAWWKSLSDEQRSALRENPPPWLGNRDGIPAVVRDEANRANFDKTRSQLRDERNRLAQGGISEDEQAEADQLDAKLKDLDAVEDTIARDNRQLLVLDASGERVKTAVAVGDVDTADHVSVFTPGFTTTAADSLKGADAETQNLVAESQREMMRAGKDGEVAGVFWLGYEAPQTDETADVTGDSVVSSESAKEGGEKLNEFYKGINSSRDTDPHLTAIGHSYGSTTTGYALQGGGHGVDDAIIYGSPGVGTNDIEDLHVPEGHTYRLEAKDDFVADLSRFGGDPSHMDGFTDLSTEKSEEGAQVTGHSDYLHPDTTSQHNIASVVGGVPENAVEGKTDGVGDALSYVPHQVQEGASAVHDWGSDRIADVKDLFS
ncbi:alpha/beta hydrolase [Saccharopolyspora sp. TS4A08]|uniref:Alpha/beta hydrolase n=1 Tax=Saccharopolyspora ipomoeae TaxID=3042027 RepID=A0ABT6PWZ8_9PSEU|nr:alpha/beta hydrolase [Saccharopolyspora sp. TS4A08]MDI2032544.1 alpha/beta hydrolase [Saccharopolyspora sp. TS4A08]